MLDLLVKDLDKEMQEMGVQEKEAQATYEVFMQDSQAKRADDANLVAEKEAAKAELEMQLQQMNGESRKTLRAGMAKAEYIKNLHTECDWLMANYDTRKEARASESDALKNAKAILSGADYSFLQSAAGAANPQPDPSGGRPSSLLRRSRGGVLAAAGAMP